MIHSSTVETWLPIEGWPNYHVSNQGRVRGPRRVMSGHATGGGYVRVKLTNGRSYQRTFLTHRLAAHAFIGPCPVGMEVNHRDGVKTNNNITNLEYVTHQRNVRHSRVVLKRPYLRGAEVGNAKLDDDRVLQVRLRYAAGGDTYYSLAQDFGITMSSISHILTGRTWQHVGGPLRGQRLEELGSARRISLSRQDRVAISAALAFARINGWERTIRRHTRLNEVIHTFRNGDRAVTVAAGSSENTAHLSICSHGSASLNDISGTFTVEQLIGILIVLKVLPAPIQK